MPKTSTHSPSAPLSSMATMGAQSPASPSSDAERRALFFNSSNAFNIRLSPVPARCFPLEQQAAFHADTVTGYIDCD